MICLHSKRLFHLARTALFAALVCAATLAVQIPAPATGGYLNLVDCFVLLSGFCIGPLWGAFAAGIGSMFADLILGYVQYAPATLLIKGLMALVAGLLCHALLKKHLSGLLPLCIRLLAAFAAEAVMSIGYLAYEAFLLGYGAGALLSLPLNLAQGGLGILLSLVLMELLQKIPSVQRMLSE